VILQRLYAALAFIQRLHWHEEDPCVQPKLNPKVQKPQCFVQLYLIPFAHPEVSCCTPFATVLGHS